MTLHGPCTLLEIYESDSTAYSQTRHKIPAVVAAHKAPGKRVFLFKGLVLKEEWSCSDGGGSGAEYYRVTKVSGGQRETAWVTQVEFQGVEKCTRFSQLTVMQNQSADIIIHEASVASTSQGPKAQELHTQFHFQTS